MNFRKCVEVFDKIEETSSRNEIIEVTADFYKQLEGREVDIFSYLLIGRVAPMFVDAEFSLSEKGLINIFEELANSLGKEIDVVGIRQKTGDIGITAQQVVELCYGGKIKRSMTLEDLYSSLWEMVNISGHGSVQRRSAIVVSLLEKMNGVEAKYLCRVITGKLRLGASDKSILDALSTALVGDKSLKKVIEENYGVDPDIGYLSHRVLALGGNSEKEDIEKNLKSTRAPKYGIPVLSRLVERVGDFEEIFDRLGSKLYLQPKYDGLRAQVHKGVNYKGSEFDDRIWSKFLEEVQEGDGLSMFGDSGGASDIKIFTRNLEEMTDMFPEVVEAIEKLSLDKVILDCEIVGWDSENLTYVPFQDTMTRKRKYDVAGASAKVPVKLFVFDIIALDKTDLTDKDLSERLEILSGIGGIESEQKNFGSEDVIMLADTKKVSDIQEVNDEFEAAVSRGLEGLIAKKIDGGYQPGKRNYEWLKLKKSMKKDLIDSVDVVIMGYYFGSGKRSGFGMGALLAGIVDEEEEVYSVTKIGTGITDQQWEMIASRLKPIESKKKPKNYHVNKDLEPDVWVLPDVICSVEADEVTSSKAHLAARGEDERGLALRFPRLIEFDRDKGLGDTTSDNELRDMYKGG